MTKPNNSNHRAKCQKYKNSGRREANKKLRQERYEQKMEKFSKRREERLNSEEEITTPKKKSKKNRRKNTVPETPPYRNKLEIQKWTSIMRKLDNYLEDIKKANKERTVTGNHPKHHKHDDINVEEQELL